MGGLLNSPSKRKRCQCVLGRAPGVGSESDLEERREVEEEEVTYVKEGQGRAEEMTAESNGYLGQLPTLSGLQVADPGMAGGWTDAHMK